MKTIYQHVKSAPAFSSKIADFLRSNPISSVHKRIIRKNFPRRRIIVRDTFQIMECDLIEYTSFGYAKANNGYRYIFLLVDLFSKMVYTRPIKKKTGIATANALQSIFSTFKYFPNSLIHDQGLEFWNKEFQSVLNQYGVHQYSIKTKTKAGGAERAIKTIKSRIERYFTLKGGKRWIDVLDDIVKGYNNTPHRIIKMAPSQVTDENRDQVFKSSFPDLGINSISPRFHIGDRVRIPRDKTLFEKGYKANWSSEIYIIRAVKSAAGVVWYKLKDINGNNLPNIYYNQQLNLVLKNDYKSSK